MLSKIYNFYVNIFAAFAGSKDKRRAVRSIMKGEASDLIKTFQIIQDVTFCSDWEESEKVIIVLVPEYPYMGGGIFSLFSIAKQLRRIKKHHGYEIILMTIPNKNQLTYLRNLNFVNDENVYRFEQIFRLKNLKELYINIPEYAASKFYENLTQKQLEYLSNLNRVDINILNQNIWAMPEFEQYKNLKRISNNITQSVAHHAYFTQNIANKYKIPTLFLPAYTDLSPYPKSTFEKKEKFIIYSPDKSPSKKAILKKIASTFPEFTLLEIKGITFDTFMTLSTKCMFSISFGEGFDGYVAQPIYQGGLAMTVYNDDFFPSPSFKQYPVFFKSNEEMLEKICEYIQYFSTHPKEYIDLNKKLVIEYDKLYSYEEYIQQLKKLANKKFELFPELEPYI